MRPRADGRARPERSGRWLWGALWGALLVGLVTLAFVTARIRAQRTLPEQWLVDVLSVPQGWVASAAESVRRSVENLARLGALQRAYQELEAQNRALKLENALLSSAATERQELRRQLGLPVLPAVQLVAADVVDREPSRWYAQIVINRGRTDGVDTGMAVLTPEGIAGQVHSVTAHTATVTLITDPRIAVGGVVARDGTAVLVEGTGALDILAVRSLEPPGPDAEPIKPGDLVVSSGLGGIYPRGVPLGVVLESAPVSGGLGFQGTLAPVVDLGRLRYVYVAVARSGGAGPASSPPAARQSGR